MESPSGSPATTRRRFLERAGTGLAGTALAAGLAARAYAAPENTISSLSWAAADAARAPCAMPSVAAAAP